MEQLALKYRPKSFDDLAGQQAVQVILRTMVATRQVPHALLFDGSRGTGKTTTARIVAASLNCEGTPVPCGHCVNCKSTFDGSSIDVLEIDAASNGLVDNIRDLRQQIMYAAGGAYRIVILDEAHSMSTAAFNALLKTLEEPPPATVFILCTTEPRKIPETVASRCMPFTFRRLAPADITARLNHIATAENITAEPALLALIAEHADGAMRDAVMTLDQMSRAGISTARAYIDLMHHTDHGADLLTAIVTGNHAEALTTLTDLRTRTGDPHAITTGLIDILGDILTINAAGPIPGHDNPRRTALASRVDTPTAVTAMRLIWDLRTKARLGDDGLDILVALLTDQFQQAAPPPAPTHPQPAKLTLTQMRGPR